MKMLFDGNNLLIRCFFVKSVGAMTLNPDYKLWKFLCIDSMYKSLIYNKNITEIILAIDYPKSWRKLYWDRYKESRKGKRDKQTVDWQMFFNQMDMLLEDITEHLPFKVLKLIHCEADDIIAVLCKERQGQYTIISTDEDFLQLSSPDVKIFNPLKRKFVTCQSPRAFIIEKCLTGQKKDDIFNILTPLDYPADKRKPSLGESKLRSILAIGYEKWLKNNNLTERYMVNKILMDFNCIPETIKTRILNTYDSYRLSDPSKIYEFFLRNGFREYIENFHQVEQQMMKLYGGYYD